MKKFYFLLVALLAINIAMAQGCLPEGITFTIQEQIDNFQTDYPGCTEIEGNLSITGNDISNLNGLSVITSIGGNFQIGELYIGNPLLTTLSGLNNLNRVRTIRKCKLMGHERVYSNYCFSQLEF